MAKPVNSMIRVFDEAKSLDYYKRAFGLEILTAFQRRLEAVDLARIGARHDQDIGVGLGIHRGADALARLIAGDHGLAAGMAAFLRADLILDHHCRCARPSIFEHVALDIERVAVAGVAVTDHRDGCGRSTAAPQTVEHLGK